MRPMQETILKTYASIQKSYIPFLLESLGKKSGASKVLVSENELEMRSVAAVLKDLVEGCEVLTFPAWDCLPYDRSSPRKDIVAERAKTLSTLARAGEKKIIVVTTVSAFLQKLPPPNYFQNKSMSVQEGQNLELEGLVQFLAQNDYHRMETVREPGEFSLRGGLIDIFPSDREEPLRIDLFGDEVESIHTFDPLTQRRGEKIKSASLSSMGEMGIGETEQERFKNRYRELFGPPGKEDEIYHQTIEGHLPKGIEHWSPLFYGRMVTLLDFVDSPEIFIEHTFFGQAQARFEEVRDYYQARVDFSQAEEGHAYNPLSPDQLYLGESDVEALFETHKPCVISPLSLPEGETIEDVGTKGLPFTIANNNFGPLKEFLKENKKKRVLFTASSVGAGERLLGILKDHGIQSIVKYGSWEKALNGPKGMPGLINLSLETGFVSPDLILITDHDLVGDRLRKMPKKRKRADLFIAEASSINLDDFLVHDVHGIGQYKGLVAVDVNEAPHDCLVLVYQDGDKLFVPVENLDILTRYGGELSGAKVDKLGHTAWQARKAKVKKDLMEMAGQLMKTAASRKYYATDPIAKQAGLYDEFCERFPFTETDDQLQVTEEVLTDLQSGNAMDRLVCGDVGFGKTEVALRAAFAVASSGKQVAVVAPTTLLCRQHFKNFAERFEGLGLRVEQLSRLVSASKAKVLKEDLYKGKIDIVVGTHALLAKSVEFANLGLIVVDEEQHFGVAQKEKLKELKTDVHVLTMTATPIPRTLQMAMSGVREMSIIATPPVDRLAVRTFVMPYDGLVIKEALMREHNRGGQSFYVCPRVKDLADLHKKLTTLVPELKIVVAHGQMQPKDLEDVMDAFYQGEYDVLLATNIIESGIDIPNANTMIVHRSDLFGLAQLYQLRGRIGRAKKRAYAYFTLSNYSTLSKNAQKRLDVMQTLDSLGAGFQLASHDMDIRGAGNILGDKQSGHIKEIGVELYQQMLSETIHELKAKKSKTEEKPMPSWSPTINLGIPVLIPEGYVADLSVRLELYRRLSHINELEEIEDFKTELIDRFGPIPEAVANLLSVIELKHLCKKTSVEKVDAGSKGFTVSFYENTFPNPGALMTFIHQNPGRIKLKPNQSLVFMDSFSDSGQKVTSIRKALKELESLIGSSSET